MMVQSVYDAEKGTQTCSSCGGRVFTETTAEETGVITARCIVCGKRVVMREAGG